MDKIRGDDPRYEIATPSSELSADGTEIRTKVRRDGSTRIEVLEGEVAVTSDTGTVRVEEGSGLSIQP